MSSLKSHEDKYVHVTRRQLLRVIFFVLLAVGWFFAIGDIIVVDDYLVSNNVDIDWTWGWLFLGLSSAGFIVIGLLNILFNFEEVKE